MSVGDTDFLEPVFINKKAEEITREQLFERIAYKIWRKYGGAISKAEAYEAARNLTGFYKTLMEIQQDKESW